MVAITADGPIWTLNLGDDENRFTSDWLQAINLALDEVEAADGPLALLTIGAGKFYSNGLDIDSPGQNLDHDAVYVGRVQALLARVLTLPVPTVAAVNGHAFGAGAMLAMAHDYRLMREDRGYFCFPEVDIHIPFTPGMTDLITSKLTPRAALNAMATGRRYTGLEAAAEGLVDAVAALDQLPAAATARVRELAGKDRATLGTIKCRIFAAVVESLCADAAV